MIYLYGSYIIIVNCNYCALVRHGRPTKSQLREHVIPSVCTRWYDLGLELLLTKDEKELDIIETNSKIEGVQICCRKMFDKWLDYDNVSWDQLVQAMRKIGLNHAATKIVELFTCKANLPYCYAGA